MNIMFSGRKIKEFRKQKKIKAIELAEMLGISKQYMFQYERGIRTPSYKRMVQIAKILDKPVCSFFEFMCKDCPTKDICPTFSLEWLE